MSRDRLTRRRLLKSSGIAAASTLLASCAQATPQPTTAPATPQAAATEATVAPEATAAPLTAESLLPPELIPGSPNHAMGWKTILPDLPPAVPVKPPVVITMNRRVDSSMKFAEGDTIDNNPFTRMAKELFGIQWKAAWTASTGEDDLQKLTLAMASGELPDVMETVPLNIYSKLLEANQLEDITDAFDALASEKWVKEPYEYGGGVAYSYIKVKGRIMGLPYVEQAAQNDKVLWIRQDWLEKVKMEPPKTLEELAATAQAFRTNNLGQGAEGTTIGLLANQSLNTWYGSLDPVIGPFGAIPGYWTEEGDGLEYDSIRPQMKEALALLRSWYADRILAQDFFTLPVSDSAGLVGGNKCGLHFSPSWAAGYGCADSIKNDPSAVWMFAQVPAGPNGKRAKHWSNPFPPALYAFRKGFAQVDLVIKQTNWFAELLQDPSKRFYGWEGVDYEWDGDVPKETGVYSTKSFYGPVGSTGNSRTDPLANAKQLKYCDEEWSKIPREKWDAKMKQYFEPENPLDKLGRDAYRFAVERSDEEGRKNRFTGLPTATMITAQATLGKLEEEALLAIITGDKPLDAFDAFVTQWKSLGGDKITQEVNEWWRNR